MLDIQKYIGFPQIVTEMIDPLTMRCEVQYLPRGIGHTIGNAMRRIMLWYDMSASVTGMKITNVTHEYQVMDGMKEAVIDVLLNIKALRFVIEEWSERVQHIAQNFHGIGVYTSDDLRLPAGVRVLNESAALFEITDPSLKFTLDMRIEKWYGYYSIEYLRNRDAEDEDADEMMMLVDNDFRVMDYVNYHVDETIDDFSGATKDKLVIEVKTRFAEYSPKQFIAFAGEVLARYASIFILDDIYIDKSLLASYTDFDHDERWYHHDGDMVKSTPIDALPLSERTRNALIKNGILYVEDLEKKKKGELLIMKGVGRKAIDEISIALANLDKTLAG